MRVVVVIVCATSLASADPGPTQSCADRRKAAVAKAMEEPDPDLRGIELAAAPRCEDFDPDRQTFDACMERRKALAAEAARQADAQARAKIFATLPHCVRDEPQPKPQGEDCETRRKDALSEAMQISDMNERGVRLAAIEVCTRVERDPDVPAAPEAYVIPVPAAFQLGVVLGWRAWSGTDGTPSGDALRLGAELGYRVADPFALLVFVGGASFTGSINYPRMITLVPPVTVLEPYAVHETIRDLGATLRARLGRGSAGVSAGLMQRHMTGPSPGGDVDLTHWYALVAGEIAFAPLTFDRLRLEVFALAGVARTSNATTTLAEIAIAARL
jgi:hypothetical protein